MVKKAIPGSAGVISVVAQKCQVTRQSMHRYFHKPKNKDLLELLEHERESLVDLAENKMATLINSGEFQPIKFLLSTRGRNRGYVQRQEVDISGKLKTHNILSEVYEEEYGDDGKGNVEEVDSGQEC
jgi:hypothetical protein